MEGAIDDKTRIIIRSNFVKLCAEIDNVGLSLLLYQRGILSCANLDLILDKCSRRERNMRLLQIITRKGSKSFQTFCDCLGETGHQDLKKLFA